MRGASTAHPVATGLAIQVGGNPQQAQNLVVADFDLDGRADAAGIAQDGAEWRLALAPGMGDGTFGRPLLFGPGTLSSSGDVLTGDFNGDGKPDLVRHRKFDDDVVVLINATAR